MLLIHIDCFFVPDQQCDYSNELYNVHNGLKAVRARLLTHDIHGLHSSAFLSGAKIFSSGL